jgi:Tfp pilus assembly protein PilW
VRLRLATKLVREERGSTLLLTIFYAALALALILLVSAATSLYLERKRLFTLADGAALVGAEAFDLSAVSLTPAGPRPTLQSADVAAAVSGYLAAAPTAPFEGLAVERAETVDGRSATVTLSAYWRPPVVSVFVPEGIPIEVTAVARSVFG